MEESMEEATIQTKIQEPAEVSVDTSVELASEGENPPADVEQNTEGKGSLTWEGAPSQEEIDAWKEQYGAGNVWATKMGRDEGYVWRTLNRFEWKKLQKTLESLSNSAQAQGSAEAQFTYEELVCEAVVLYPKLNKSDLQSKKAGLASLLTQQILDASGFVSVDVKPL